MKSFKLVLLLFIISGMFFSCNPDDNNGPVVEFRIDENQQNWKKRLLIQRPISDVSGSLPGEYAETKIFMAYTGGDTVTVAASFVRNQPYSMIFMSFDRGLTWSGQESVNGIFTSTFQSGETTYALREYLGDVYFGKGMQYGASWTWTGIGGSPGEILALSNDTLLVYGNDGIRYSTNQGTTWQLASTSVAGDIIAINDSTIAGVFGNDIRVSSNLGQTWTNVFTSLTTLHSLSFSNDGTLYAGGENGSIQKSSDGGQTWYQVFVLTQIYAQATPAITNHVHMIDAMNGFAAISTSGYINCGDDFDAMTACIVRTADGGETWSVNYRSEFMRFSKLFSTSGPTVLAVAEQWRDNYISGSYVTMTTTLGN